MTSLFSIKNLLGSNLMDERLVGLIRFLCKMVGGIFWGLPLPRDISYHCPIILKYDNQLRGLKPSRFNNHCLSHIGFSDVVLASWVSSMFQGWKPFILLEKSRSLKSILKGWNKHVSGDTDHQIDSLSFMVEGFDFVADFIALCIEEMDSRSKVIYDFWTLIRAKESMLSQRANYKWIKEGDANTNFFMLLLKVEVEGIPF